MAKIDNTMSRDDWSDTPEQRITREEIRARKGGLQTAPGDGSGDPKGVGRFLERLVIRELQKMAHENEWPELRFEHGIVVGDYGDEKYDGASASGAGSVNMDKSPVFDIVCYRGDVAWTYSDGRPLAVVPESFLHGVIEVKRGINNSNLDEINKQLQYQQEYLQKSLNYQFIQALVGIQYFGGQLASVCQESISDYVALIGDINKSSSANQKMTDPASAGPRCFVGRGALEDLASVFAEEAKS